MDVCRITYNRCCHNCLLQRMKYLWVLLSHREYFWTPRTIIPSATRNCSTFLMQSFEIKLRAQTLALQLGSGCSIPKPLFSVGWPSFPKAFRSKSWPGLPQNERADSKSIKERQKCHNTAWEIRARRSGSSPAAAIPKGPSLSTLNRWLHSFNELPNVRCSTIRAALDYL